MNQTWLSEIVEERPLFVGERLQLTLELAFTHLSKSKKRVRLLPHDRKAIREGLQGTWQQ